MQRDIFTPEHDAFRDMVRTFIAREITPYHEQWERDGMVSRDVWLAAGRAGLLGIEIDEKYGGGGNPDYRYYLILDEELAVAGATGPGFAVHNDINGHYFSQPVHPRAARAVAARVLLRRAHHRDRDDRARGGQRPAGDPHHRRPRRRSLPAQRQQDLHLQRAAVRPGDRRRPDRSGRRAPGDQPAGGGAGHARLRARPQPRQDRHARPGHLRALVHRRAPSRPPTCSARRAAASSR